MGRKAAAGRVWRGLSFVVTTAGLAVSTSGVVVLARGGQTPPAAASSTTAVAPSTTAEPSTTAAAPSTTAAAPSTTEAAPSTSAAAPSTTTTAGAGTDPGWVSCVSSSEDLRVSFPEWWSTPTSGEEACRVLRAVDSGDAGTGYIQIERVRGISLREYTDQLSLPRADVSWTDHRADDRAGREMLWATGTMIDASDLPVVTMFAVELDNDVVTVTSFSAGMSAYGEDELAAITTTVEST